MNINIDLERLGAGSARVQPSNNTKNAASAETIKEGASGTDHNTPNKRTIIDAVIINQIAQSFFQKAVLISSRLKGIAVEALNLGKVKEKELNSTLADISALNNMQESINNASVPVQSKNPVIASITVDLPEMEDEVSSLKGFAQDIQSGNINLKKIDRINNQLSNQLDALHSSFVELTKEFSVQDNTSFSDNKFTELAQSTVAQISEYPEAALITQGNIGSGVARNLL